MKSAIDDKIARWGKKRPFVYHMAYEENRDSIRRHGLLSTEALVDLLGLPGAERDLLLAKHRPSPTRLRNRSGELVVVRDQKPLNPNVLERHLTDMTLEQWFRKLNSFVFFWMKRERLDGMIACSEYCNLRTLVFKIRTADLLKAHPCACVTTINTGNTKMMPVDRGTATFSPFRTYSQGLGRAAELVVPYAVTDILACTEAITVEQAGKVVAKISPGSF